MAVLDSWELILLLIPLSLITLTIIVGNLLVIIAVASQKFLQTLSNVFLVSLAIADLFVGLFILPLNLHQIIHGGDWEFGATSCKIWVTADMTLCSISIFNICLIAWDRYRSITDGVEYLRRRTLQSALTKIVAIWFVALWISSPPLLGWIPHEDSNDDEDDKAFGSNNSSSTGTTECMLSNESGFVIHSALGSLIVPTIAMIVLYVKIYHTIQRRLIERSKLHTLGHQHMSSIIIDPDTDYEHGSKSGVFVTVTEAAAGNGELSSTEASDATTRMAPNATASSTSSESTNTGTESNGNNLGVVLKPKSTKSFQHQHSVQIQKILQKKVQFSLTRERRAAKVLGVIMWSFIICWLPFSLMYIIESFLPRELKPGYAIYQAITWLGYINSALNPIIYTVFSVDFRKAFKRLLHIKT